jgi:dolichol-phosphate mannosyltransferase
VDSDFGENVNRLAVNYVQFCLVGFSGMAVDMGLLFLLSSPGGFAFGLTVSKVLAAETAVFNNFLWNELWTFRQARGGGSIQRLRRFVRFNLICLAGIGISVGLLDLQVYGLGMNRYLANFTAIVVASFWNFFMSRRFGWRISKGDLG